MRALWDLMCQAAVGLLICSSLAIGMAYVGGSTAVGQTITRNPDGAGRLVIGSCRGCGHPIHFNRDEWCAYCSRCQTLTNVDQVPGHRPTEEGGFPNLFSVR